MFVAERRILITSLSFGQFLVVSLRKNCKSSIQESMYRMFGRLCATSWSWHRCCPCCGCRNQSNTGSWYRRRRSPTTHSLCGFCCFVSLMSCAEPFVITFVGLWTDVTMKTVLSSLWTIYWLAVADVEFRLVFFDLHGRVTHGSVIKIVNPGRLKIMWRRACDSAMISWKVMSWKVQGRKVRETTGFKTSFEHSRHSMSSTQASRKKICEINMYFRVMG